MKRFKNILYFADGITKDSPALKRAVSLAEDNQARLTIMDIIDEFDPNPELEKRLGKTIEQLLADTRISELSELITSYQEKGQVIYTQVQRGTPFVEVIRAVQRNHFDLVIKTASAPTGITERLFGSTDLHLLRKCPCPVWIERPGTPQPYRQVLAAVNPVHDKEDENCDNLVMQLATSLAQREQAELGIVHAWRLEGESLLRSGRSPLPRDEIDYLVTEERKQRSAAIDALLANYELPPTKVHLDKGDAAPLILQYSAHADVIVMGTVGRTGIPGLIIGNTAEEVLQNAQASVLAVKPEGFQSPVLES